jgi:hypothetical protein
MGRAKSDFDFGTLDLKAIFQWLEHSNVHGQSCPNVQTGSSVKALQGWEIAQPAGCPSSSTGRGSRSTAVP